jgi:hypothetical protein
MARRLTLRISRLTSLVALLNLLTLLHFPALPAGALEIGRVERTHAVGSAAWAVVAHGRTQPATPAPYILLWTVTGGTAYDYLYLRNTGSIILQSFRVAVTQVRLTGNANSQEIFFERCVAGSWNPSTNLCSGSVTLIGRASDGQLSLTNLNLAVGSSVEVRARTLPNNQSTFETTLATQVRRSDFRIAETRNS